MIGDRQLREYLLPLMRWGLVTSLLMMLGQVSKAQTNPFNLRYATRGDTTIESSGQSVALQPQTPTGLDTAASAISDVVPSTGEGLGDESHRSQSTIREDTLRAATTSTEVDPAATLSDGMSTSSDVRDRAKGWPLSLILIASALVTTMIISNQKQAVSRIFKAVLNPNYMSLLHREHLRQRTRAYLGHFVLFSINAGLFAYLLISSRVSSPTFFIWFIFICILSVALIYACRHLFLTYLGVIYPIAAEANRFSFSILIFNAVLGVLLLPINFFIAFSPSGIAEAFMVIGCLLVLLLYLYRQMRGLLIGLPMLLRSKFYFLLYLCAVEIAPIVLLIHFCGGLVS